ncbi:hypothetical protein chiPu_0030312, partial [Chiloscyllium punctatum]|nr:hypothetical protein [Chiloscyllium punctatum]
QQLTDIAERQPFAGKLRPRRAVEAELAGLARPRRRQLGNRGRAEILRRVEIEVHQRRLRAAGLPLQHRKRAHAGLRIERGPARKAARQYLQRQDRRRDLHKTLVGLLGASGRRGLAQPLPEFVMPFDERPEPRPPQHVGQAGIAMDVVIALDQVAALRREIGRQEIQIDVADLFARTVDHVGHDARRSVAPAARIRRMKSA